jgi:hypothetical protein
MIIDLSHDGKVPIAFWRMEMRSSTGEMIKVAEGSQLPVRMDVNIPTKVIKIADGLVPPTENAGKIIKVAEDEGTRKIIKVAEGEELPVTDKRRIIKVAGREPLQMDVLAPEDKDTRKVECIVVLRDILGNQTKTKISDLQEFADKQAMDAKGDDVSPVWVDEF